MCITLRSSENRLIKAVTEAVTIDIPATPGNHHKDNQNRKWKQPYETEWCKGDQVNPKKPIQNVLVVSVKYNSTFPLIQLQHLQNACGKIPGPASLASRRVVTMFKAIATAKNSSDIMPA